MPTKADSVETDEARSRAVVDAYRRHKLARSALGRIRNLISEFDESRAVDAKLARVGIVTLLVLLGLALVFLFSGERITFS